MYRSEDIVELVIGPGCWFRRALLADFDEHQRDSLWPGEVLIILPVLVKSDNVKAGRYRLWQQSKMVLCRSSRA